MNSLTPLAALSILFCLTPTELEAANKPNILFICVDDLRPELSCYGKRHMHTPYIDKLASQGRVFSRHYVQVPTCGASRNALLTGRYPRSRSDYGNNAISAHSKNNRVFPTFPKT